MDGSNDLVVNEMMDHRVVRLLVRCGITPTGVYYWIHQCKNLDSIDQICFGQEFIPMAMASCACFVCDGD